MPQSKLTPAAQRRLASTVLQLTETQGFMYLPVLAQSQASAQAVVAYLESSVQSGLYRVLWPMAVEQKSDDEFKKTQLDQAALAHAQLQALKAQRTDLLASLDQAIATLPPSTLLVLDVSSSTRHALALNLITYLNLRREPLRSAKLRLLLCWPQEYKEALIAGAPDLWSMRTDSLWIEQTDLNPQNLTTVEQPQRIEHEFEALDLSPAQHRQLAQWQQHGQLDQANISVGEGLNLLNKLAFNGRAAVFESLAEALEAKIPLEQGLKKELYTGHLLNAIANQHSFAGDINAALSTAKRAVDIREKLALTSPVAYEPHLATSLNNLASFYSNVGEHSAALETAQRTVAIYEKLALASPAAYEPNLAASLNNLANCYSYTGDLPAALSTANWAVEIREKLALASPTPYEPALAGSLNNLASFYSKAGEHSAALETAQRAVAIREKLAQASPAAYEPDLAGSLNNLASFYSNAGDHAAALSTAQRAVAIREKLAQASPAAYEPVLAGSLNNLANRYSNAGDHPAALSTAQRAVDIFKKYYALHPAAFERNYTIAKRVLEGLKAS